MGFLCDIGAAGQFKASQWTNNIDVSREFDLGWATPLNFAIGLEPRRDTWEIVAGDRASRYKEGSQSPGSAGALPSARQARRHR